MASEYNLIEYLVASLKLKNHIELADRAKLGVEHFNKKADYVQRVEFIVVRVNADGEKERCEFLENDFVSQILEDGREVLIPAANLTGDRFCESFSIALARIPLLQAHFRLLVEYQNSVDHSRIETKVLKLIS